jgi:protein phosphatase
MALDITRREDGRMEMIAVDVPVVGSLRAGARTSTGRGRRRNEDAHLCGPTWFAVADGIGGQPAGEVASRMAIDVLRDQPAPGDLSDLAVVVAAINDEVRAVARRVGTNGMGTTLVAVTPIAGGLAVVHIGDSLRSTTCDNVTAVVVDAPGVAA